MALTIADADYNRILTSVGYPIVEATDLGLTDAQIKELFILPVLSEVYCVYFPIKAYYQGIVDTSFSVPFPDATTFGIVDARVNTRPFEGGSKVANPIINELIISETGGRNMRKWGTDNDYGYTQVHIYERMERDAGVDDRKAIKIHVNKVDRVVEGYSNTYGNLSITWAKYSEDFSDVQFIHKRDMIKLAQARLMEYVGMLRTQATNDLPTELDGAELLQKAEEYTDAVIEKWQKFPKVVILR